MSFADRIKALDFPLDQVVVIGSGLLDQLGIRSAHDIDLVVSPELFRTLATDTNYQQATGADGWHSLTAGELDIWDGWGDDDFASLARSAQEIDGVKFIATKALIAKKRELNREKDRRDIAALEVI